MKLTDLELKIFKHIWSLGGKATVQAILDAWSEVPQPQYTTILKTLQILQEKKLVTFEKQGRAYLYVPLVSEKEAMKANVLGLVKTFFGGNKLAFAQTLINENEFSSSELAELKKLLDRKTEGDKNVVE